MLIAYFEATSHGSTVHQRVVPDSGKYTSTCQPNYSALYSTSVPHSYSFLAYTHYHYISAQSISSQLGNISTTWDLQCVGHTTRAQIEQKTVTRVGGEP
jgi:hypothetical protein